jgi:hypothetical protein
MRRIALGVFALGFLWAQTQHTPRGTATDVSNDDIQATVKKTASAAVSDQAIRVVGINDEVQRRRRRGASRENGGQADAQRD